MTESIFREIIDKNSKLKAKLKLLDGSILWVREIWIKGKLDSYSYYWLRSDETIIMGWDNAPHHKEIDTFPHHRHIKDEICPSLERNLESVLKFIREFLNI